MFLAVSAKFSNFVEFLAGSEIYYFILRLLILGLVWWFGLRAEQKSRSPLRLGFLWIWGLASIAYAVFFIWIVIVYTIPGDDFIGWGWIINGLCSLYALVPYFTYLMYKTVTTTFPKKKSPAPAEETPEN